MQTDQYSLTHFGVEGRAASGTIFNDDPGFGPSDLTMARGTTVEGVLDVGSPVPQRMTFPLQSSHPAVPVPASFTIEAGESRAYVVRIPELPLGKASITLTDPSGRVTTTGPIFRIVEAAPPRITAATPASLPRGGELVLEGSGFRPAPFDPDAGCGNRGRTVRH